MPPDRPARTVTVVVVPGPSRATVASPADGERIELTVDGDLPVTAVERTDG